MTVQDQTDQPVSDEVVSEEDEETLVLVGRALAADPRTADSLLSVEAKDGQVLLRGETAADGVKDAAEDVVWGVPTVHEVVNDIQVRSRDSQGDQ